MVRITTIAQREANSPWPVEQIHAWRNNLEGIREFQITYAPTPHRATVWRAMQSVLQDWGSGQIVQHYSAPVIYFDRWGRHRKTVNMVRVEWPNAVWVNENRLSRNMIEEFLAEHPNPIRAVEELEVAKVLVEMAIGVRVPVAAPEAPEELVQMEIEVDDNVEAPKAAFPLAIVGGQKFKAIMLERYGQDQE